MNAKSFSPDDFCYDPDNTEEAPNVLPMVKKKTTPPPLPPAPPPTNINRDLQPPPHSPPSEKTVLSVWWMIAEKREIIKRSGVCPEWFHIPAHRIMWGILSENPNADHPFVIQQLTDAGNLEKVGGPSILAELMNYSPFAGSLDLHLEVLRKKFIARKALARARDLIEEIQSEPEDIEKAVSDASVDIGKSVRHARIDGIMTTKQIFDFDIQDDQSSLIGYQNRFLGKSGSWIIAGPSGIGKSTFTTGFLLCASCGAPWHGITFRHPMRVLVVQAENDEGDLKEMLEGAYKAAGLSRERLVTTTENLFWKRMSTLTGDEFVRWLEMAIVEARADLVHIDPILAYVGDDISLQSVASHFFRNLIQPVLDRTGAIMTAVHHTGKTSTDSKSRENWSESDFAYLGFGSSELTNWARAVGVLVPWGKDTGLFRFLIAKRGKRAGMINAYTKERATSILLQHAETGMGWVQAPEPEMEEKPRNQGARPKLTVDDIMPYVTKYDSPVNKKELTRDLERDFHVSYKTAREKIDSMIHSGALKIHSTDARKEGGYPVVWLVKGGGE